MTKGNQKAMTVTNLDAALRVSLEIMIRFNDADASERRVPTSVFCDVDGEGNLLSLEILSVRHLIGPFSLHSDLDAGSCNAPGTLRYYEDVDILHVDLMHSDGRYRHSVPLEGFLLVDEHGTLRAVCIGFDPLAEVEPPIKVFRRTFLDRP